MENRKAPKSADFGAHITDSFWAYRLFLDYFSENIVSF